MLRCAERVCIICLLLGKNRIGILPSSVNSVSALSVLCDSCIGVLWRVGLVLHAVRRDFKTCPGKLLHRKQIYRLPTDPR